MSLTRRTKTVKLFLDLFEKKNGAISIIELVSIFKNDMNKTTVYRILTRLEESGILHSFVDKKGLKRYAKNPLEKNQLKINPHIRTFFVRIVVYQNVFQLKFKIQLYLI